MKKTRAMRLIELEYGDKPIQTILTEMFDQHETAYAVANALGVSYPTLIDWLDDLGATRTKARRYSTTVSFPEETAAVS